MSCVVRLSDSDLLALKAILDYRCNAVSCSTINRGTKINIVSSISNESLADQIHFVIKQYMLDYVNKN